jgi:hypothetical protein
MSPTSAGDDRRGEGADAWQLGEQRADQAQGVPGQLAGDRGQLQGGEPGRARAAPAPADRLVISVPATMAWIRLRSRVRSGTRWTRCRSTARGCHGGGVIRASDSRSARSSLGQPAARPGPGTAQRLLRATGAAKLPTATPAWPARCS